MTTVCEIPPIQHLVTSTTAEQQTQRRGGEGRGRRGRRVAGSDGKCVRKQHSLYLWGNQRYSLFSDSFDLRFFTFSPTTAPPNHPVLSVTSELLTSQPDQQNQLCAAAAWFYQNHRQNDAGLRASCLQELQLLLLCSVTTVDPIGSDNLNKTKSKLFLKCLLTKVKGRRGCFCICQCSCWDNSVSEIYHGQLDRF